MQGDPVSLWLQRKGGGDFATHRDAADALRGDPAAEPGSQQQREHSEKKKKRKRERKEKPTLHKVRLGCHERQPDKGFFMDGISIQAAQPFLSGSGVRAREHAPIAGEDSVSQARISRLRAPTSNPLRSPSIPPQSAG